MARINRPIVNKLNRLPQMAALSTIHPNASAAGHAFGELIAAACRLDVSIRPVIGGPTVLESGTKQYIHTLCVVDTEDEMENSTLVRQVYDLPHGSVEVTAYFS